MTVEQLRNAHRSSPFRPFTVHMVDGRAFYVPHPDFLFMTPGRTVIICKEGPNDEFSILDLLLMSEIEMSPADRAQA